MLLQNKITARVFISRISNGNNEIKARRKPCIIKWPHLTLKKGSKGKFNTWKRLSDYEIS